MADFNPIFELTLGHEGGFQNNASDNANYCNGQLIGTNRGISAVAYKTYYGACPTVAAMKALTKDQARDIYKKNYWDKINGDEIKNQSVAELMFQFIIGSGSSQLSDLRNIANGVAGKAELPLNDIPMTNKDSSFINGLDQYKYWSALRTWRYAFYDRIIAANPDLAQFRDGWRKRLGSYTFKETSLIPDKKKIIIILLLSAGLAAVLLTSGSIKNLSLTKKILIGLSCIIFVYLGWLLYEKIKTEINN